MPSPFVANRRLEEFVSAFEADAFAASATVSSAHHAQALPAEFTPLSDPACEDGARMKGVAYAIGLEAAAALCVYGAWQFWQVLR
jgi:hypothetical protein